MTQSLIGIDTFTCETEAKAGRQAAAAAAADKFVRRMESALK